ncbi:MAG: hypothetical protein GTO03_15120, partial [Planctomycetales bacterium]|nr:hypothetical protein [Planctomycetales bacterium]
VAPQAQVTRLAAPVAPGRVDFLGSRKTVTVHLADSAGEAMAKAERSNPGWRAIDAREVGNRVWQVVMVKD